jgi:hypothetical protein
MSIPEDVSLESVRRQLQEKLRSVNEQLRKEMLARGFDPAQYENLALTAPLAKLYMKREQLRAQLDTLSGGGKITIERDES